MAFQEINSKMVQATVAPGQRLFSQRGAMLAYRGEVSFTPNLRGGQGGVMSMIGRRVANEDTPLMTVEGSGTVFFGHGGHHVQVINLSGDTLYVEADRLLAFEGTLEQSTVFLGSQGGVMGMVRGQVSGQGLFTTSLRGHGSVAVMAHGGVFEVPITPQRPVRVDPQAYVAHHGDVRNKLSTALGWRDMVGRGSGEAFQLELSGSGTVFVQASEEKLEPYGVRHGALQVEQLRMGGGHLQLGAQRRDRAAQLVRGVRDEAALPLHRGLQRGQRLVGGRGEPGHLVVGARHGDAAGQVLAGGDRGHLPPDALHRAQRAPGHQPGHPCHDREQQR
ncbi:hypothetical protein SVIOM342S_02517 [Streptomyces violaceorubidus]